MTLIELFTDYVYNRKDLREYVEKRKEMNERGEFNDATIILAQENLERLQKENPEIYEGMYETLNEYIKCNFQQPLEYPIDFVRIVAKLYKHRFTPEKMYANYKGGLSHHTCDL